MESLSNEENYKYLDFLPLNSILAQKMEEKIVSAFEKGLIMILKTKFNSEHKCKAINTWATPVYLHCFGVENWSCTGLSQANRTIRATVMWMVLLFLFHIKQQSIYAELIHRESCQSMLV
uniref:Uncharacterized protein n=1 Tax=Glossina pallidipes TaxID=7398 RepID=A0A1B0AI50_GLOPL